MDTDSTLQILKNMRSELKDLYAEVGAEIARLTDTKENLVGTFSQLTELLDQLLGEKQTANAAMEMSNRNITFIEEQGTALRCMRDIASEKAIDWSRTFDRVRDTARSLSQLYDEIDSTQLATWNTMAILRDNSFKMAGYSDNDLNFEDLCAQDRENFEKIRQEAKRKSELVITAALKLDMRSRIQIESDKMYEELEKWRQAQGVQQKLRQGKLRHISQRPERHRRQI